MAIRSRISRSRRRSGRRTGPGTGTGIAERRISMPENTAAENPPQYQPGVTQYRPININISIRINSPGNDGPVTQTNIAVVVTAPALPKLRIEVPAPLPTQAGGAVVASASSTGLSFIAAVVNDVFGDPAAQAAEEDECCAAAEPSGVAAAVHEPRSLLLPQAPPPNRRDITAKDRFSASVAVTDSAREGLGGRGARCAAGSEACAAPSGAPALRDADARDRVRAPRLRLRATEHTRWPPGVLHAPGRRVRVRHCFRRRIALGRRRGACSRRGS